MSLGIEKGQLTELVHDIKKSRDRLDNRKYSNMPKKQDFWNVYGSSYRDYERSFRPFKFSFDDFLKDRKSPIVIDLLAPTRTITGLFGSLRKDEARGIAVSLSDQRTRREKRLDGTLGITHVSGNLSDIATWKKLEEELGNQKADLIIERGVGGCRYLPKNDLYLLFALRRIWNMLSSNDGTFFAESYEFNHDHIFEWVEYAQSRSVDAEFRYGILRAVKHTDSPAALPTFFQPFQFQEDRDRF